MSDVYTARVAVRHDELDCFGRIRPAVYLRYLAHAAVEASTAAGYGAAWYAAAGAMWLIRRSTFDVLAPVGEGAELRIRTWVDDFRRVRSHRRYEVYGAGDVLHLAARTDWVYVNAATGRPRRVPPEMEAALGGAGRMQEREPWPARVPPPVPARALHRVRLHELDAIGHVNNAAYLDLCVQATFDALAGVGWPLARMLEAGGVPTLVRADVEYLDAALYGDTLALATWFTAADDAVEAHQEIARERDARLLVRAATRWRWLGPVPAEALAALGPLLGR
ncbi:MAG TPA: thioesterase family protein [Candidatus Binatia bacterium]|nr:thioesterase family protein [Candidatus Binatia bacterium]